ncbi:iron uptake porin [Baaleninema sp.]|uniref:iron uptake porin n=1 Tax=Baaleninema sp. TaxID=3101197 RepID=UPI003D07A68D
MKERTNQTILRSFLRVSPLLVGLVSLAWATDASAKEATAARSEKSAPVLSASKGLNEVSDLETSQQLAQTVTVDELSAYELRESLDQVTSVSQLSDVQPTDWAFQALQSLVERYGCIAGYPDGTYRGNNFMTRYEFAAGVNACLDQIVALIGGGETIDPADLATVRRLQEEFAAELAALRGRVDGLEARVAELEANQFSTTTKLSGEVIFSLNDTFGEFVDFDEDNDGDDPTQTNFHYRATLNFDTSFTGRDRLRTRLRAGNATAFNAGVTGTDMTRLYDETNSDNAMRIDDFSYRFPVGDNFRVWLLAHSNEAYDFANMLSPQESDGSGSISRFGRFNPLFRQPGGAGLAVQGDFGDLHMDVMYLADNANDPSLKNGLFNGQHSAMANLTYNLGERMALGLTYSRYYAPAGEVNFTGSTGSDLAQSPFGDSVAASSDSLGAQFLVGLGPVDLTGWFGYSWARAESDGNGFEEDDKADLINYALALTAPDLGGEGNLAGLVVGVPPQATRIERADPTLVAGEDDDTSLHIEAFYRYALTDNILITPGFFVITSPEHNDNNDAHWVATLRTTFKF